jgi:hypothetical protein
MMESFSQIKLSIPTSRAYRCTATVTQSSSPSQNLISRSMAHIVSDPLAYFCQQNDTTLMPVTPGGQSRRLIPDRCGPMTVPILGLPIGSRAEIAHGGFSSSRLTPQYGQCLGRAEKIGTAIFLAMAPSAPLHLGHRIVQKITDMGSTTTPKTMGSESERLAAGQLSRRLGSAY